MTVQDCSSRSPRALDSAGLNVRSARVETLGAEVVDAFYLTDGAGRPLSASQAGEARAAARTPSSLRPPTVEARF